MAMKKLAAGAWRRELLLHSLGATTWVLLPFCLGQLCSVSPGFLMCLTHKASKCPSFRGTKNKRDGHAPKAKPTCDSKGQWRSRLTMRLHARKRAEMEGEGKNGSQLGVKGCCSWLGAGHRRCRGRGAVLELALSAVGTLQSWWRTSWSSGGCSSMWSMPLLFGLFQCAWKPLITREGAKRKDQAALCLGARQVV